MDNKENLPGYYDEIPNPWEKKDTILEVFSQYEIEVHSKDEPEFDYLECDDAIVIVIKNPYWDKNLEFELDAEFSIFFGGYHTHYFTYEYDFNQMLQLAKDILENRLCAVTTWSGETWIGSRLSDHPLTIEEFYADGGGDLGAIMQGAKQTTEIRNIFWKLED